MVSLSSIGVVLLAAVTLLMLWLQDRTRAYLALWSAAHGALLVLLGASGFLYGPEPALRHAALAVYIAAAAALTLCQLQGALLYRGWRLAPRALASAAGLLAAALLLPLLLSQLVLTRALAVTAVSAAFLATAVVLWPLGWLERGAAVGFAVRALLGAVSAPAIAQLAPQRLIEITHELAGATTVATTLLVVFMAFNRVLSDLREHYRFLSISQEITTALQGLLDEREMARCVVDLFLRHGKWDIGALALYCPERGDFEIAHASGERLRGEIEPRLACTGLAGLAFRTQRLAYSLDVVSDERVPAPLREIARSRGTTSQICIPLVHDGAALGVLILPAAGPRALFPFEIETMESLGKIIGMSLTHLRVLQTMTHRANHDSLTGLDNRAALHEWFARHPAGRPTTLMLFDLNGFKEINDALGHSAGDQLLQALAQRLRESLAGERVRVYRLGGDEFVILYDDVVDARENTRRARRLAELIGLPFHIGEVCLRTSASIGIAEAPRHGSSSHELLRCADMAMYRAKHNGWTITFYEQGRDEDVRDRVQLLSGFVDGLERGEFELYYQPLIDLRDGGCRGCEGLLRWRHPERGLLGAGLFMPFVEATDMIHRLTQKVAELAIRDAAAWRARGVAPKVSINLSARNLLDAGLPEQLLRMLREHRLDPGCLQLEVTETVLMKDPVAATAILQRLRDSGFTIALDDFGTGYSSLAYLARFPIHLLKIDQTFIRSMLSDRRSRAIVQSTVELAHMLDLAVAAEGIESAAEARLLTEFGCDFGQGYHFAKPLPRDEFEAWWRRGGAARQTAAR